MSDIAHCFTLKHTGKSNKIVTPLAFGIPNQSDEEVSNLFQTQCLWDTGATNSVITQNATSKI